MIKLTWAKIKPGLIPSLDIPFDHLSILLQNIDEIRINDRNPIYALKIGALLEHEGLQKVVKHIKEYSNLPIIVDHQKLADIPSIITKYVEKLASFEIDGVILLGYVGPTSITTFVETCQAHGMANYIVAEMSHQGASEYIKADTPVKIAELARKLKATGIVCPATKIQSIQLCANVLAGSNLGIMSPGHGAQGGGADSAVKAGADWIVVGRSFYTSLAPQETLIKIGKDIFDNWMMRT